MAMQETHVYTPDHLFAGKSMPVVTGTMTVANQSKVLKRGTLLDDAGKVVALATEAYAVLAEDADVTEGTKNALVYFTGEFNEAALIVNEVTTVSAKIKGARKVGIFVKKLH